MLNSLVIIGRLTRKPEQRTTMSGKSLTRFTIAVDGGTRAAPEVSFFDCSAWGERGEFIERHFDKGDPIIILGKLRQATWTTKNGEERRAVEIVVNNANFPPKPRNTVQPGAVAKSEISDEPYEDDGEPLPFEI